MIAPATSLSSSLTIVIPGVPVAWARTARGFGARKGGSYSSFTPERQRSWKAVAQAHMAAARVGRGLFDGPLSLSILAVWPRPKSLRRSLGAGRLWRTSRPDADNVGKLVADAAIGVLYADDSVVVRLEVEKFVAAAGEAPRVEVVVRELVSPSGAGGSDA